ncbi:MAG: hypothetical protein ACOX5J_04605 [Candidatus Hydrogenedentales bacterium]|jgi:hypothetical protein
MSEADPQNVQSRQNRSIMAAVVMLFGGAVLLALGLGLGFWFASRYDISIARRGAAAPTGHPAPAAQQDSWASAHPGAPSRPAAPPRDAAAATPQTVTTSEALWPLSPAEQSQGQADGPFAFKFTRDETLRYRVATEIRGKGIEGLTDSGVLMNFESGMSLHTRDVDPAGNALLRMTFDQTSLQGSFLDEQFSMEVTPDDARVDTRGQTPVDTRRDVGSTQGIPQLEFLQDPVDLVVAPNGQVLKLSNTQNMAAMLTAVPRFATLEFPGGALAPGQQWESRIALPVPGFGTAAETRLLNTFVGYEHMKGRLCGVIEQQFLSEQTGGALHAPESALGQALNLSMPVFQLSGENRVFFDTANGQLVLADLDLGLRMDFSNVLGNLSRALGGLLAHPDALSGAPASDLDELLGLGTGGPSPLLSLDLNLLGSMELVD